MSELKSKSIHDMYWSSECGVGTNRKVYLKSEADKVIAELKDKALQYKVLYKEMCRDINSQEQHFAKQLYRHKYKRCLAIASKCRLRARWFGDNSFYKKEKWALKWHRTWLELAEKFKEAK